MAKAKTKKAVTKKSIDKKKNNLVVFWEKYTTQILVGLATLAVVGYWFGSVKLPAIQEKRDLDASYVELQEIADKISAVEEPDSREEEKYCSYSSAKFEKGDLSCGVNISIEYNNVSPAKANSLKSSISKVVSTNKLSNSSTKPDVDFPEFYDPEIDNIYQVISDKNVYCSASYQYPYGLNDTKKMGISFNCIKVGAKTEHYPVKD